MLTNEGQTNETLEIISLSHFLTFYSDKITRQEILMDKCCLHCDLHFRGTRYTRLRGTEFTLTLVTPARIVRQAAMFEAHSPH